MSCHGFPEILWTRHKCTAEFGSVYSICFSPATEKSYNAMVFAIVMFSRTGHATQYVAGCLSWSLSWRERVWPKSKLIPK